MKATQFDIEMEQGATFDEISFTWWTDSTKTAPVNLTGYSARMQMREDYDDADPQFEVLSTTVGEITLGGAAGTVDVVVPATKTAAITARKGFYDLELVSPSGKVVKLMKGRVTVFPEVTK